MPSAARGEADTLLRALRGCDTEAQVLAVMDGASYEAFRLLDEMPALFDPEHRQHGWSILLRQVRNGDNDLFDRLRRGT